MPVVRVFLLYLFILGVHGIWQVGLMFNQGSIVMDNGYNQQAYQGLVDAKNTYDPDLTYDYQISVNDSNLMTSMPFIDNWVNQSYDVIFFLSFTLQGLFELAATTYINNNHTRFVLIDNEPPTVPLNAQSIIFREDQAAYLVGVLAAKVTKTKTVGVVGGLSIGPVTKYMSGFVNGVKFICPTCVILQQFLLSFENLDVGSIVAQSMVDSGADIIFAAAGASGNTALTTAASLNTSAGDPVYVLGVDVDQYSTIFIGANDSTKILSSAMKRVDTAIGLVIASVIEGKFQRGAQKVFDAANFAVDFAPCHESCLAWGNTTQSIMETTKSNLGDGILLTYVAPDGENFPFVPLDNEWKEIKSPSGFLPARSGQAAASNIDGFQGEEIAIFGGVADAGTAGDLWFYHSHVYSLTQMTNRNLVAGVFPVARSGHTLTTLDPMRISVLFGGKTASSTFINEVSLLIFAAPIDDPYARWITLPPLSPSPLGLIDHTAVSIPGTNQLLIFGGRSFSSVENTLWKFTLGTSAQGYNDSFWEEMTTSDQLPQINRHSAVLIDNCMYIFGGVGSESSSAVGSTIWRYNLTNAQWKRLADAPVSRSYHASVVVQNITTINGSTVYGDELMLTYGGRDIHGVPSADTWLYNPLTDTWQIHIVAGAVSRFRHSLLAINNRVYAIAGSNAVGQVFIENTNLRDISAFQFNGTFTILPAALITDQSEQWRTVIGALIVTYMLISMIGTFIVIILRNRVYPLRASSRFLLLLINFGAFLFINIPLKHIAGADYPCWLYYWLHYLAPPLFMTPILMSVYRQELMYKFSRSKRRWAGCAELSESQLAEIKREKHKFRDLLLLLWTFLALIPIFIIAAATFAAGHDAYDYSAGHYGCGQSARVGWALGVYFFFYLGLLILGVTRIRNYHEVWSFRLELFYLCLYGGVFGILYMLFRYTTPVDSKGKDDLAYLFWIIPVLYHFRAIFIPSLRTLPVYIALTSGGEPQDCEPLADILATKRGFQYFLYYTAGEFSQENPLCWRAIQGFKLKTSYNSFCDLYTKYCARGSPLEVNISHTTLTSIEEAFKRSNESTPLEELQSAYDVAQMELMLLMQEDSYKRFLQSELYQRYKRNEPLRDLDEDRAPEVSRTHAISSNPSINDADMTPKLQNAYLENNGIGRPLMGRKSIATTGDDDDDRDEETKLSMRTGLKGLTDSDIILRLREELKHARERIVELEKLVDKQKRISINHSKSLSLTGPPSVSHGGGEELSRISEGPSPGGIELARLDKEDSPSPSVPLFQSQDSGEHSTEHLSLISTSKSSSPGTNGSSKDTSDFFTTLNIPATSTTPARRSVMDSGLQKP